jgi:lysophospholipase L1-like esterase
MLVVMARMIKVFGFGDSIRYGSSDTEHSGWFDRLKSWSNSFNNSDVRFKFFNLGIGGEETCHFLKRFKNDTDSRITLSDENIFIFAFGANDVAILSGEKISRNPIELYSSNLITAIQQAKAYSPNIILLNITPITEALVNNGINSDKTRFNKDIQRYNEKLKEICQSEDIDLIDIHSVLTKYAPTEILSEDGLHPSSEGHSVMYQVVLSFLKEKMGIE